VTVASRWCHKAELTDNKQIVGDVVIGADGVRSKARELVLGYVDKPKSSGYAVWRAWYSLPQTAMLAYFHLSDSDEE
jgi:2-polyprenyl-6-methoxyphenol hydroxylase-like FAD-dependent oxidoreductase